MVVYSRVVAIALAESLLLPPPAARAQGIPVFDVALIAKYVQLIATTSATYQKLLEQFETQTRMSRGLSGMNRFSVPPIASPGHDTARYPTGAPLLRTLNSGDPNGANYYQVVRPLSRDVSTFDQLPPDVRQQLRADYASVEILDSTNHEAANAVGATRVYNQTLAEQLTALERIITSGDTAEHQLTAVLDTIATAELIGARQDTAASQIEAHLVGQRLAKAKVDRDAQVAYLTMVLTRLRDRGQTANALVRNARTPANGGQP